MSGSGDKKDSGVPAGAKEKIRRAQMLRKGQNPDEIDQKGNDKGSEDLAVHLVIIYGLAVAAALLVTQGPLSKGAPFHLPWPILQAWLLGHPPLRITGNGDTDLLIAVFARGTVFFLLAGLIPLLARLLQLAARRKKAGLALFWAANVLVLAAGFMILRIG